MPRFVYLTQAAIGSTALDAAKEAGSDQVNIDRATLVSVVYMPLRLQPLDVVCGGEGCMYAVGGGCKRFRGDGGTSILWEKMPVGCYGCFVGREGISWEKDSAVFLKERRGGILVRTIFVSIKTETQINI